MPSLFQISAKERRAARERFLKVRIAERQYMTHLGAVGRNIGGIVRGFAAKGIVLDPAALDEALNAYSRLLIPWARAVSARMIQDVAGRDLAAWKHLTTAIGSRLYKDLRETPTGALHGALMEEQVRLITSLPLDAARRVHTLTREALVTGKRAEDIAKEIEQSGHVSVDRARLIARTEVGRTASSFVQVRAEFVGSEGYWWRTVGDSDVRPALSLSAAARAKFVGSHRALNGKYIKWSEPPVSGQKGERAHAGRIYNCRCWPEPILPDTL